jgi:acetyl-CoA C-acetyltransferase
MSRAVIVAAVRTPIGKFLGKLSHLTAPELAALTIQEALLRASLDRGLVEDVIFGNVVGAAIGQAPARQAALKAGLPHSVSALTINKVCGSGLQAVMLATSAIKAGDAEIVVAGGMESMSNAPHLMKGLRGGIKYGDQKVVDALIHDGLWDSFNDNHMGFFADYTAKKSGVTREMQDAFAVQSHQKAIGARDLLKQEIVAIQLKDRKGAVVETIDYDEGPRSDASTEKLAQLKPAFTADGTVTAGNASPLSDGAASLIVMSEQRARTLGIKPLAAITAMTTSGVDPKDIFFAPAYAIQMVLKKLGMTHVNEFDAIEVNEAFAAQALANEQALEWDRSKVNIRGGAVALGHPIGASGARVLVTLLHILQSSKGKRGLASLCLGGGNAVALAVEML